MFRKFLIVALIGLSAWNLPAQHSLTGHPDWQIKPVISRGFILVHRISIGHLVKGYPTTYEFNISKPTLGNKLWQLENNKPDIGVTLQCLDFANPSQLGYALTAAPYVEIPLNEKEKASRMILRVCWGATYITKRFDIHQNHKNVAIGSHVNSFVQFRWFWHLKLSERLRFEPGITFTHASNGKARNPNLGLNVVSISAGLNYLISAKTLPQVSTIDSSGRVKSKNELCIGTAIGFNQRSIATEGLNSLLLALSYNRNVRNTHKFSLGTDFYYDENYFLDYEKLLNKEPAGIDKVRVGLRAGYAYNVGRISLPIEIGYYIFQRVNPDASIYSRLGVRYYSASNVFFSFGLRTHFAVAYTFEYGVGYRIPFKR